VVASNIVDKYDDNHNGSVDAPPTTSSETQSSTHIDAEPAASDSDSDLEAKIVKVLFRRGCERLADREFDKAEKSLKHCLSKLSLITNGRQHPGRAGTPVARTKVLQALYLSYREQEKWDDARSTLAEKVSINS